MGGGNKSFKALMNIDLNIAKTEFSKFAFLLIHPLFLMLINIQIMSSTINWDNLADFCCYFEITLFK